MNREEYAQTIREATPEGERTSADEIAQLETFLPDGWQVTTLRIWGPKQTNHGGRVAWKIRLDHVDGARLHSSPTDPRDRPHGTQKVIIAHRIARYYADDSRKILVEPHERVYKRSEVFGALLAGAVQFSTRYQLFHPTSASA